MKFSVGRRPDPLLDVTPMIDIVFQLVLFFMVSTTFVNAPGIQVDLPRSSEDTLITEQQDLHIWMTCGEGEGCVEGAVYVGDEAVTEGELDRRLRRTAEEDPSTLVVIKADQGVSHGRVVTVMDLARTKGLSRLAIATEVAERPPEQGVAE